MKSNTKQLEVFREQKYLVCVVGNYCTTVFLMCLLQYIFCLDVVNAVDVTLLQKNLLILTLYTFLAGVPLWFYVENGIGKSHIPENRLISPLLPFWLHPALT